MKTSIALIALALAVVYLQLQVNELKDASVKNSNSIKTNAESISSLVTVIQVVRDYAISHR